MIYHTKLLQKVQQNLTQTNTLLEIARKMRNAGPHFDVHKMQCIINADHDLFFVGNKEELAFVLCNKSCKKEDLCTALGISPEDLDKSSFWKPKDHHGEARGTSTVTLRVSKK